MGQKTGFPRRASSRVRNLGLRASICKFECVHVHCLRVWFQGIPRNAGEALGITVRCIYGSCVLPRNVGEALGITARCIYGSCVLPRNVGDAFGDCIWEEAAHSLRLPSVGPLSRRSIVKNPRKSLDRLAEPVLWAIIGYLALYVDHVAEPDRQFYIPSSLVYVAF